MVVMAERNSYGSWSFPGESGIPAVTTVDELVERSVHMTSEEVLNAARAMSLTSNQRRELASKLRRLLPKNLGSQTAKNMRGWRAG